VVRLAGSNADKAFEMLEKFAKENKDKIVLKVVKGFDDAADEAVHSATK
jgi:succinyl-CoA synthetase beta subunit